jgi:urease gamma subunit
VDGCLGGAAMPIHPFLEGEVFEQELIDTMSKALADACRELGLKHKEDAAVRLLARRIIDATRDGIHDPELLTAAALAGLGPTRQH